MVCLSKRIAARIMESSMLYDITWDYQEVYVQHHISLTFCRALQFLMWCRSFKVRNNAYPIASSDVLGNEQPIDPFSDGRKFSYIKGMFGSGNLHSFGSDGVHDDGKGTHWTDSWGSDIIFPITIRGR